MTIAFYNKKGGTGKTTSAASIESALRERGHTVALYNLDTQRNLKDAQFVLPEFLETVLGNSDTEFNLLDCPPAFDEASATALRYADVVVIPVQPEPYAIEGLQDVLATIEEVRSRGYHVDFRILMTMMDSRIRVCREIEENVRDVMGSLVLRTSIKESSKFIEATIVKKSVIDYAPKSPGAVAYRDVCAELLGE